MLEKYIIELEEDLKINELNLKDYQLRLPGIKHKWASRYIKHKLEVINLNKKCDSLKKKLFEKIQEASPVKLSPATINSAIEQHKEYTELANNLHEIKLIVELLEKTEKTLHSATFDIKNLVEIMKLETT